MKDIYHIAIGDSAACQFDLALRQTGGICEASNRSLLTKKVLYLRERGWLTARLVQGQCPFGERGEGKASSHG